MLKQSFGSLEKNNLTRALDGRPTTCGHWWGML